MYCPRADQRGGWPDQRAEAFKLFYRAFRSAFPGIKIAVRQCITEGNMCADRCDVSGTHKGNGLGVPATGRPIFFTGVAVTRVEHGMIQEAWNSFDFLSLHQQIGLARRSPA